MQFRERGRRQKTIARHRQRREYPAIHGTRTHGWTGFDRRETPDREVGLLAIDLPINREVKQAHSVASAWSRQQGLFSE